MSNWECSICGYVHEGPAPPEKCPVCDAAAKMFEQVQAREPAPEQPAATAERRWRCTVCGYIHTGDEPPDTCPVCDAPKNMFVEIDAEGKPLGEEPAKPAAVPQPIYPVGGEAVAVSLFDRLVRLSLKLHLHPITVHFPNGILPVVVVFLALSVQFNIMSLEAAAFFNLVFVLLMLPLVLVTGYFEWQKRYRGARTAIFITKITCSLIVLTLVNILVFWRLLDPTVASEGSGYRMIYLGLAVAMLGTVALAGHLGGKLVFGSRGD